MNIKIIEYFITIVENNFNITQAAKKLYISQPALSKAINRFEEEHSIILFNRSKGRLHDLTPVGTTLYVKGEKLIQEYNEMVDSVMHEAEEIQGAIDIGISPVIISFLFPDVLPKFIRKNPKIHLNITEEGAVSLKDKLIDHQIDIATLLSPTGLSKKDFEQIKLTENKLVVFMDKNNPLANNNLITWKDLDQQAIAIFSDTYMVNQQITDFLLDNNSSPRIQLKSDSWDLLLNSTYKSNLITILPEPISNFHNMKDIVMIDFEEDIKWDIYLCRRKKKVYSNVEDYTFNYFVDYFEHEYLP